MSRVRVRSTLSHEAGHGLFHTPLFVEKLECEALERRFDDGDGVFDTSVVFADRMMFPEGRKPLSS